ncbi:MFS transporter [Leifsonia poae]|uniref:MFS transporter n=1 Tax=Leifsonia poae TaxID=110933 RepID=A0A9W6LXY0_9MICO|nr:MFS transporter [Leifsonia poae]GLJ74623.1 MFS transporter [Leifsonia poae]
MTGRRQLALTLLVAGTFFMENLDGTILATAAPTIGRAYGIDSAAVGLAITAYLVTLAVLIPISGWLTQRLGARTVFAGAIAVFTIASVLCAASSDLAQLTAMRILQGAGGAMMVPVGRLAVLRVTEKKDLVRAIAWLTWPALAAPVVAPLVGGLLVTYASWQWIFLLNIPLGVVAFVAALRLTPVEPETSRAPLDVLGFVLTFTGVGGIVVFGALLADPSAPIAATIVSGAAGALLTAAALWHLGRAAHPLLDLRAFRIETFRVTHAGGSLFRLTISAVPFLLPLFFQDALGWSPVQAGAVVLTLFVGNLMIKPATTPMLRRWGFRTVLIVSTAGAVLSMIAAAFIAPLTPIAAIVVLLVLSGMTRSTGFTAYNTIAFADVPRDEMTGANTLASTVQQIAAGLGVAVGAVALRFGGPLAQLLGLGGPAGAYRVAFVLIGLITVGSVVEAVRLSPGAGENIRPVPVARRV